MIGVVGVGLASGATRAEVEELVRAVTARAGFELPSIAVIATRHRFTDDHRLRFGPPVVGVDDATLLATFPARRRGDRPGFPARVAEGCALTAAGPEAELVVATTRSAHATVALATAPRHPTAHR